MGKIIILGKEKNLQLLLNWTYILHNENKCFKDLMKTLLKSYWIKWHLWRLMGTRDVRTQSPRAQPVLCLPVSCPPVPVPSPCLVPCPVPPVPSSCLVPCPVPPVTAPVPSPCPILCPVPPMTVPSPARDRA